MVFVFLLVPIKREPRIAPAEADNPKTASVKNYWTWIAVIVGIPVAGGTIGLCVIIGTVGLLLSILSFVILRPLQVQLVAMIDSFLFLYQAQRA